MSKVILVTGSNTGIGFELARLLAEKGATVYIGARNEAAGRQARYGDSSSIFSAQYLIREFYVEGMS